MKKLLAYILACGMTFTYANELKSFDDIHHSLLQGKPIRLLIHFNDCSPKPAPAIANLDVYTSPTAVIIGKDHLQFANSPLTTSNPENKPILENCTYRITDNEVNITIRTITLPNYLVASEKIVVCPIGTAVRVFN